MGILDTAKDVITLVQKADNLELVKQVLALQADIMKMMDENRALKDEIRTLRDQLNTRGKLIFRENTYWLSMDNGKDDGPFCSTCHDTEQKLVRLHALSIGGYRCPACTLKRIVGKEK
jgi:regulator of replication initiation timing